MSIIPLDLQRQCERRWAARFAQPVPPKKQVGRINNLPHPPNPKEKTRRLEAAGSKRLSAG